jgi:endonuclease/exonuclease/phosphatase (EEP) superfamily protein YafD
VRSIVLFLLFLFGCVSCANFLPWPILFLDRNQNLSFVYLVVHLFCLSGLGLIHIKWYVRIVLILLHFVPLCFYVFWLLPYLIPASPDYIIGEPKTISVLSLNLGSSLESAGAGSALVEKLKPDVIVLTGDRSLRMAFGEKNEAYLLKYPPAGEPRVLSRLAQDAAFPALTDVSNLNQRLPEVDLLALAVAPGQSLRLAAVSLPWPRDDAGLKDNYLVLRRVTSILRERGEPVIFCGEFNATPFSRILRAFSSGLGEGREFVNAAAWRGPSWSWLVNNVLLARGAKHIFYTENNIRVREFKTLHEKGLASEGVLVTFELPL